jgi:hypothetical protein
MKKVYLAKSNLSSGLVVAKVREYLERIEGVQVIEWKGMGSYSEDALMESDYLVVIPETLDRHRTHLGRGLHSQIESFSRKLYRHSRVLIVTDLNDVNVMAAQYISLERASGNEWARYAYINILSGGVDSLHRFIDTSVITVSPMKIMAGSSSFSVEESFSAGAVEAYLSEPEYGTTPMPVFNKEMFVLIG